MPRREWLEFRGASVSPGWPRRLLHIPSMTSVERDHGNAYCGMTEPDYCILSYTWGRWQQDEGPRPAISGTSWPIPSVDSSRCYKLDDLYRVIAKMGEEADFAWIDIACIDQENYEVKMEEVGRQASIFANARRAYVWLWTIDAAVLSRMLSTSVMPGIEPSILVKSGNRKPHPRRDDLERLMADVWAAVDYLLGDFWFSSLWTLQESVLREDAWILGRDGSLLTCVEPNICWSQPNTGEPYEMIKVINRVVAIYTQLTAYSRRYESSFTIGLRDAIKDRIQKSGYSDGIAENPNVQFAAAWLRKTTYQLDRIYGIMALYDIQVGAAAPGRLHKARSYSLEELSGEFVTALNAKSPLLGQMFVHTERPARQTWQITQQSRVPGLTMTHYTNRHRACPDCSITGLPGLSTARIEGWLTPLQDLFSFWKACEGTDILPQGHRNDTRMNLYFQLDDYIYREHPSLPDAEASYSGWEEEEPDFDKEYDFERDSEVLDFSEEARPLRLFIRDAVYRTAQGLLDAFHASRVSVLRLGTQEGRDGYELSLFYGLVLLHGPDGAASCERLGLCIWPVEPWNGVVLRDEGMPRWTKHLGILH